VLVLAAAFALAASSAAALTLDELMHELQGVAERHATFEETKQIALLTTPITRRGSLDYMRPDRLRMQVDKPYFERLDIAGDTVTVERSTGVSRIALSTQPALSAWIASLRATLAGDAAALQARFDVRVSGTLAQWRLDLTPRDAALAAVVERLAIAGHGSDVVRFEVDERKGDSSRMTISPK
jgi:hypothetical protein